MYFVLKNRISKIYIFPLLIILFICVITIPYLIIADNQIVNFVMNNIYYRESFMIRTRYWADARKYINFNSIIGYGYNNSSIIYIDKISDTICAGNAHNEIIQRIMNVGIIGLILFVINNVIVIKKVSSFKSSFMKTLFIFLEKSV